MSVGLCQYLVEDDSDTRALEIAMATAEVPSLSDFAIRSTIHIHARCLHLMRHIMKAFVAGVVNTQAGAGDRLAAFADKTVARVKP